MSFGLKCFSIRFLLIFSWVSIRSWISVSFALLDIAFNSSVSWVICSLLALTKWCTGKSLSLSKKLCAILSWPKIISTGLNPVRGVTVWFISLLTKKGKSSQFSVLELAVAKSFLIKVFTCPTALSAFPRLEGLLAEAFTICMFSVAMSFSHCKFRKHGPLSWCTLVTLKLCSTLYKNTLHTSCADLLFNGYTNIKSESTHCTISRWDRPPTEFKDSARSTETSSKGNSGTG